MHDELLNMPRPFLQNARAIPQSGPETLSFEANEFIGTDTSKLKPSMHKPFSEKCKARHDSVEAG